MVWRVDLAETAKKQLLKLGSNEARRITAFLRSKIDGADDPRRYGKALKGPLGDLWSYRVGDFRLICDLDDQVCSVLVVQVGHRTDIYR